MRNLSISAVKKLYAENIETPRSLLFSLRQQALEQSDFNAWIHLLSEAELSVYLDQLADKSPETHPLYGVPFAIKDNIDLAGITTTAACKEFSYLPEKSAFVVQLLLDAGAIPLGKTNLDQFATGLVGVRSPYGEGKNAFNPDYISGGSSAGSAIATALGQVSFALGTDTAGSGRVPAALNNLIGLKPSKGLISTSGVVPACKSLDCVSIFSLSSLDAAKVLEVAAKEDATDCYSETGKWQNSLNYLTPVKSPFKFAVPSQLEFSGNAECEQLFAQAVDQLTKLGGEKIAIDFTPFTEAAKLLYEGPWVAERQWATQGVDHNVMEPAIQTILNPENTATAIDCFAATYKLAALKKQCDALIASVDFVLTPTMPTVFTREQIAQEPIAYNSVLGTYTNFMNLLDYAAVAVPVGQLASSVSWGVTLFNHRDTDMALLAFSDALHQSLQLKGGAGEHAVESIKAIESAVKPVPPKEIDVVVCGAHLSGMALNWQLIDRGAKLISQTQSAEKYKLFALPDGKRPALVFDENAGSAIEVEVWRLPAEHFGSFVAGIPAPLGIGKTELANGQVLPGFICEQNGLAGAKDVSEYGGWRAWCASGSDF